MLFRSVIADSGASKQFAGVKIFNKPRPNPQLRWSPDGTMLALLGFSESGPQVFAVPLSAGAPFVRVASVLYVASRTSRGRPW